MQKRLTRRWALWLPAALIALVLLPLTLLVFPQLLAPRSARAGSVVIHYDGASDPALERLAADVNQRLLESGLYDPARGDRVFFLRSQRLYSLLARLAMVPPEAQGFALSFVGNAFVSESNVKTLGTRTGGMPKHSIWEGSAAHTIAHELAHLELTSRIGRKRWSELPQWKREGIPEYMANIAAVRTDAQGDLGMRLHTLHDARNWPSPRSRDREHYEAGLLVEFVIEVQGYTLPEVTADTVTRAETVAALEAWAEGRE